MTHWQEIERPAEWLRRLDEQDGAYERLVRQSGNLALAAHRLARAKCRALGAGDGIPTLREVMAAARTIGERVSEPTESPSSSVIRAELRGLCISDPPPRS